MNALSGVRASAGAGKTWRLTGRYLQLLRRGARPESILAATFTRKAAGEILARVLARLAAAAGDERKRAELSAELGPPALDAAECRDLLAGLVRALDRVAIGTLDSFFHRLARAFRFELDLPPDAVLSDGEDARAERLRAAALQALIRAAADGGRLGDLQALLAAVHAGAAKSQVAEDLLGQMSLLYGAWREAPDARAWVALPPAAGRLAAADLDARLAAALAVAERYNERHRKAVRALVDMVRKGDAAAVFGGTFARNLATGADTFYGAPIPRDLIEACEPVVGHARAVLQDELREKGRALHALASEFGRLYDDLRRREGVLLYDDIPYLLGPVLAGRDAEVVPARLGGAIDHLLLDEFQDTNPRQWGILRPLAERIVGVLQRDPAARASVFAVGDVKQSIYGWRGATPEIFRALGRDLPGLRFEDMTRSWRSSPVVLRAVDKVFTGLASSRYADRLGAAAAAWDEGYVPHEARHAGLPGHVVLRTAAPASDDDEHPTLRRAAAIVADLRRGAPFASIGVLVRRNDAVKPALLELERAGVEASGEGTMSVVDEPAVEAILSALELADHPGATLASFHLSHGPLAAHLREGWQPGDVLDGAERAALACRIREQLVREGPGAVVAAWARVLARSCDARGARRLAQVVELVEAYEPAATLRPIDLVRYLENARAEEPLPAAVRVLTVHKAKGLEFDAVVLPDLDGDLSRDRDPIVVDRRGPGGPVAAIYPNPGKDAREVFPALAEAAERAETRARTEALCVLYVALTRARHALHAVVAPRSYGRKGELNEGPFCPASLLRQGLAAAVETDAGDEVLYEDGDPAWFAAVERAARPAAPAAGAAPEIPVAAAPAGVRRTLRRVSPSGLEKGGEVRVDDLLRRSTTDARRFGLLIHAWFALVGFADDPEPADDALLAAARRELPDADEGWFRASLPAFREILARPGVRAALARPGYPHRLLAEKGFAALVDGALLAGRFDRVLLRLDGDGRAVGAEVLDFKTDQLTPGRRDAVVAGYAPQMEAYKGALAALLGLPPGAVTARLLFTRTGEAVTV